MSGVTDAPFRKQASAFGVSAAITEMVAGDDLLAGRREAVQRFKPSGDGKPYVVQLVGLDAAPFKAGAKLARIAGADVIDINMGCPSRRVTGGLSGSALMRDLDRAEELIEAVLEGAQGVPVTLKMRLGWDWDNLNAAELGLRAQKIGVQLLTVHGRTRQDFYDNTADWRAISDVVSAVDIPVIANGDIVDVASAKAALNQSKAVGVMIGRAATGLAWLPSAIEKALMTGRDMIVPSLSVQLESLAQQSYDSVELYGERVGIRVVRKHLAAAFDYWAAQAEFCLEKLQTLKTKACQAQSLQDLTQALNQAKGLELEVVT